MHPISLVWCVSRGKNVVPRTPEFGPPYTKIHGYVPESIFLEYTCIGGQKQWKECTNYRLVF